MFNVKPKWIDRYLRHRRRNIIEFCARIADNAYDKKNPTLHKSGRTIGNLIRSFK